MCSKKKKRSFNVNFHSFLAQGPCINGFGIVLFFVDSGSSLTKQASTSSSAEVLHFLKIALYRNRS